MRIYVALELKRSEGKAVSADAVREEFEAELADTLDVDESSYDVTVLGIGGTKAELDESIKLRKANHA